jgi:hypothetical protein
MGMRESRSKIATSYKDLLAIWFNVVKPQWQDKNAQEIEVWLLSLEHDVVDATRAMDDMAVLLDSIKRECSDNDE